MEEERPGGPAVGGLVLFHEATHDDFIRRLRCLEDFLPHEVS